MTDADRSDELVSAYLDGEATADEAARVESDPVLLARLDVLRGASTALGSPITPPPAARREAAIAAALATTPELAGVTQLAPARQLRQRRTVRLLSAAAVVLALAIAVPVIASLGDDDGSTDIAAADRDGADQSERSANDTASVLAAPALPIELGALDGEAELADAIRQNGFAQGAVAAGAADDGTATGSSGEPGAGGSGPAPVTESDSAFTSSVACLDALPTELAGVERLFEATATLDGLPVTVFVFAGPDGTVDGGRAVAFDTADCSIEADVEL